MYIPIATYRLQFHGEFKLSDAAPLTDYFQKLGVNTLYASPVFGSRSGSTHNYDVVNPLIIDPEIGSLEEFHKLTAELHKRQIGWLQDIVPNHMAFDSQNLWLMDVLEKGPDSDYRKFFDVAWERHPEWNGKIMVPFLGAPLENVLANQELHLQFHPQGLLLSYYENTYPLNAAAYEHLLKGTEAWPSIDKNQRWEDQKQELFKFYRENEEARKKLEAHLAEISRDREQMKSLLNQQYYTLEYWKLSEQKINYRRFFTINDLICLRMEEPEVFDEYHRFVKQMMDNEHIQGLRIDHIDGLFDPKGYMDSLRKLCGDKVYLLVEKILEWDEQLPADWEGQGTTGYEFLATVSQVLTHTEGEEAFSKFYEEITGNQLVYEDIVFQKKHFILTEKMGGELENLLHLAQSLNLLPEPENEEWKQALAVFMAAFPIYRIYPQNLPPAKKELDFVLEAEETALIHHPELSDKIRHLAALFEAESEEQQMPEAQRLPFVQRSQQFTGPLAAKGVEDTTFYTFNRLISHNEVGDTPAIFGMNVELFHEKMLDRRKLMPHAINATATHDTKRGEDARMRINVLSERAEQWIEKVKDWQDINQDFKKELDGKACPDANEEYLIYQVLIGLVPFDHPLNESFGQELIDRLKDYLTKALREAKIHTDWSAVNEEYEQQVCDFAEQIVKHTPFLEDFLPFARLTTHFGVQNSLAQTLIKLTAPGVPDIYQGCELWDLSMVDPDNRRPVDYELRTKMLEEIESTELSPAFLQQLLGGYASGKVKMFLIWKVLQHRNALEKLYREGEYLPLSVSDELHEQVIAYARKLDGQWSITIIPRNFSQKLEAGQWPLGEQIWQDAVLKLPDDAPKKWSNELSGQQLGSENQQLKLAEVFQEFPVALLKAKA